MGKWNTDRQSNDHRIESPKINPSIYGQIIFNKGAKRNHSDYSGSLGILYDFYDGFFYVCKTHCWDFNRNCIEFVDHFDIRKFFLSLLNFIQTSS